MDSPHIKDNSDGTITVEYQPKSVGKHEVQMEYNGASVNGSPFQCIVDSVGGGYVTAFGKGLQGGGSGEVVEFTVVAQQGHARDLQVVIDGPGKVDLNRKDNADGSIDFNFMPMTPGAYNLNIKYNGKHIKGSPFTTKISGAGRKRSQLSLSNSSEYNLKIVESNVVNLVGSLKTPEGSVEPVILKKLGDGELGIASFSPKSKGKYQLNVYQDEHAIKGSPFSIQVGDNEIAHAAKVHVTGATTSCVANDTNDLKIDTTNAGYGSLSVAIEGPHRSEIDCLEAKDRKYDVHYSPHEPGIYILNIRYADDHVPGSPFLLEAKGNPSGRIRETVTKVMEACDASQPGKDNTFILKIPGTNPFDMEAAITNPDGATELCDVVDEEDFHYLIHFKPAISGVHILSVKHKGLHIAGSPFPYSVGQLSQGGFHKVQAGGPGLERGEVGISNDFNIYTREAGPGSLTISIEGPSKCTIKLEERQNGSLGCSYFCKNAGRYGVHIKFDDHHIPNSPFIVNVAPDSGEAKSVSVQSLKDRGLQVDKPNTFAVHLNGASGTLHGTIRSPTGGHEDCFIQEMDRGVYAVRFIPKENGVHYIDILLNDAHIPDSPFAIMVGHVGADPALVTATGQGLETGKCGSKNKFVVKTAGAGTGILTVMVEGPSKSAISCKELDEGYEFSYTPFSVGKYLITIKYGNIPIAGSPYQSEITGTGRKPAPITEQSTMIVETVDKKAGAGSKKVFRGDASKVTVRGPGLKKAFNNKQQKITIDVKEAGLALLTCGMISPSGHPEGELFLKKMTNTTYELLYKVVEAGEHTLYIRYGEDDIPGSPFSLST
ncbi:hypothetical protein LOTGIDRAFT_221912 [Lottia gigantea]|uniref:Uncharacterized protein n=1 Tax=Lottia gigantea TaxID=225164 RepID=V3ZQK6_LOTGI|nr:hypothetical protein LOTGIDRAFT_221912 [Lottia gigantea]ESO84790.1 hypothetical protein LOTGIDRAFT_221912 [Lottia gigantea]